MRRCQNLESTVLRGGNGLAKRAPDVVPADRLLHATADAHERLHKAPIAFGPVRSEAADVAPAIAVYLGIESGRDARQLRAACPLGLRLKPHGRVAALRAERADCVARQRVVPRPRFEAVVA